MTITQLYENVSYIMRFASSIRLSKKHTFKCLGNANNHRILHMHVIRAPWCRDFPLLKSPLVKDWVCSISFSHPYSTLNISHYLRFSTYFFKFAHGSPSFVLASHLDQSHPPNDWLG